MSKGLTAKIPLGGIAKSEVYINTGRKTMKQIQTLLECDYLLNTALFHSDFTAASYLVKGGKILCDKCDPRGYALGGEITYSYANNVKAPDFLGGYPALIASGSDLKSSVPAGLGGSRGRSAMGLAKDSLILRCIPDGANDFTLSELTADMLGLGCESAVNFDGGGSSQCYFAGQCITSSRIVYAYLAIWMKKEGNKLNCVCNKKTGVLDSSGRAENGRYIGKNDRCVIGAITQSMLIEVTYPVSGGTRKAYVRDLGNFRQG